MAKSDPRFRARLDREINLAIQEMRDGCLDCPPHGLLCDRHLSEAADLVLHAKQRLGIKSQKKSRVTRRAGEG